MNKKKGIIIGAVLFFLVVVVGYAIFSDTLTINGTATAKGEFDIEFNRVNSVSEIGSKGATAEISEDKNTLTINAPKLEYPSSYVEVDVTIKNTGSINAVLKGIEVQGVENPDIKVTYTGITEDEILGSNQEKDMKIKVLWDAESTATDVNASFTIKIVYEQYNGTEIPPTTPSDTYEVGDTFCLGEECFYVIKDNGDSVTALARYNLLVGNRCTGGQNTCTPIDTSTEGYGLQSASAKGYTLSSSIRVGTIAFSETNYWVDDEGSLKPEYGSNYPANVYDSNSLLYEHVENYESYLKSLGKTSVSARLITYDELLNLGCSVDSLTCSSAPSWVYGTSYLSTSAQNDKQVWMVIPELFLYGNFFSDFVGGVRPVITISKTEI